jgi:hypothetical protein
MLHRVTPVDGQSSTIARFGRERPPCFTLVNQSPRTQSKSFLFDTATVRIMDSNAVDTQELLQLMQRLSPGERSVLAATLETPDSQIATVRNTANDRLWSKMVELGLAQEMTLEINLPPALQHVQPRSFALTELGRVKVRQLLPTRAT